MNGEQCRSCKGSKVCRKCHEHVAFLREFVHECSTSNLGPAEAVLIRALQWTVEAETQNKSVYGMKGMGGGTLLGTFIAPGVGTVLGGMLGKMLGDTVAVTDIPDKLSWRRADLWFCMGLLYQMTNRSAEASQAWIKALTYKSDHEPSRFALK